MNSTSRTISILGAGTIGTALGNILLDRPANRVTLFSIEENVVQSVNRDSINPKYFPGIHLNPSLKASSDFKTLLQSDIIFLAIPSGAIVTHLNSIREFIPAKAILVNLAKGFGEEHKTITKCLQENYSNPVCTLKGPSFAKEIINRVPTSFTLGARTREETDRILSVFEGTTIFLDFTDDLEGVEILSVLKNIYAIGMGIIDAHYNSPNIRFLFLTKAFNEMRKILLHFGGREETIFKYCGYGDFTLTALNDLSRNRTLGLLIGKGFFTENVSHDLVLEGQVAVSIFYEEISKVLDIEKEFPVISALYSVLFKEYDFSRYIKTILHLP